MSVLLDFRTMTFDDFTEVTRQAMKGRAIGALQKSYVEFGLQKDKFVLPPQVAPITAPLTAPPTASGDDFGVEDDTSFLAGFGVMTAVQAEALVSRKDFYEAEFTF